MANVNINGQDIDVKQYTNDWALALMSQGVIVKVSVSRWRATAQLSHEDLGLKFSDSEGLSFMKKYIRLGKESLLPPSVLAEVDAIEFRSRQLLRDYSFPTVWGYFVPYTAFNDWERENEIVKADFLEAATKLGERYDEIVDMVKNDYRLMAKDVWMRLYPDQGDATESFIEDFASKIVSKIPNKIDIVTSFKYDVTYLIIPMPSVIEENMSKAQEIKLEREQKVFDNELEKDAKRRISEIYTQRKQEYIDEFLEATVANMRKYISELCDSVLLSLVSSEKDITAPQKNKIKKMIDKISKLNFYGDKEIQNMLNDLNYEMDKFKGERNKSIVVLKLQQIVETGKKEFLPPEVNPYLNSIDI